MKFQFRFVSIILATLALIILTLLSDPTMPKLFEGVPYGANLLILAKTVASYGVSAAILHIARRTLADYLDVSVFYEKSLQTPQSAATALIGLAIYMVAFAIVFHTVTNLF